MDHAPLPPGLVLTTVSTTEIVIFVVKVYKGHCPPSVLVYGADIDIVFENFLKTFFTES